jgi:hypothetical protein
MFLPSFYHAIVLPGSPRHEELVPVSVMGVLLVGLLVSQTMVFLLSALPASSLAVFSKHSTLALEWKMAPLVLIGTRESFDFLTVTKMLSVVVLWVST